MILYHLYKLHDVILNDKWDLTKYGDTSGNPNPNPNPTASWEIGDI